MTPQLTRRIDQAIASLEGKDLSGIGYEIVTAAAVYFEYPGGNDDFCIQHIGETIVFGGTNRLCWHPAWGYYPDRAYCSPRFLQRYEQIGRLPNIHIREEEKR